MARATNHRGGNKKHTIDRLHPRGAHWPPDCPRCRGFGYVREVDSRGELMNWAVCPDCLAHPGHTMTHLRWATVRECRG